MRRRFRKNRDRKSLALEGRENIRVKRSGARPRVLRRDVQPDVPRFQTWMYHCSSCSPADCRRLLPPSRPEAQWSGEAVADRSSRFWLRFGRNRRAERADFHHSFRLEAFIDIREAHEALNRESGANQQDEGKNHLYDHESAANVS